MAPSPLARTNGPFRSRSRLRATPSTIWKVAESSLKSVFSAWSPLTAVSCLPSTDFAWRSAFPRLMPLIAPSRTCSAALPFSRDFSSATLRPAVSTSSVTRPLPSIQSRAATSFTSWFTFTPVAAPFIAMRLARASANAVALSWPPHARPCSCVTRSMPPSSAASRATSLTRYCRYARLPARRLSWPSTARKAARSTGVSALPPAGLPGAAAACGGPSRRFRSSASKCAFAATCGVTPASITVPSVAKAAWLSWPWRFQLERFVDATALPCVATTYTGSFGSSMRACRSSLSRASDGSPGFRVRSACSVPSSLRCGALPDHWATKPGSRTASKLPAGA